VGLYSPREAALAAVGATTVGRLPRARPEPRLVPKELGSVAAAGALEVAGDGAAESACAGVALDMDGSDMTGFICLV